MAEKPHFHGHRERLRKRFDEAGADALPDYELLELLLCQALPRRDVKPLAKKLIERFGTIGGVLGAERNALKEVAGVGDGVVHTLKLVEALGVRTLREPIIGRPVIATWQAVLDYCTARLGKEKTEHFRVLFLDNHNALIADEEQQHGTVDHVVLYPREVNQAGAGARCERRRARAQPPLGQSQPVPRRHRAHQGGREGRRHVGRDRPRSPGDRPLPPRLLQGGRPAAGLRTRTPAGLRARSVTTVENATYASPSRRSAS